MQRLHLAGINNQNFLMRDEATGSWWQQSTGEAVLGPLRGRRLDAVAFEELTFATWRAEHPNGRVLAPDPEVLAKERYAKPDWEVRMAKAPVVAAVVEGDAFAPRDLVIGLQAGGASRAYAVAGIKEHRVVADVLGGVPVALVLADDGLSVRAFESRVAGRDIELFIVPDATPAWGGR